MCQGLDNGNYLGDDHGGPVVRLLAADVELVERSGRGEVGTGGSVVISHYNKSAGSRGHDTVGSAQRNLGE